MTPDATSPLQSRLARPDTGPRLKQIRNYRGPARPRGLFNKLTVARQQMLFSPAEDIGLLSQHPGTKTSVGHELGEARR